MQAPGSSTVALLVLLPLFAWLGVLAGYCIAYAIGLARWRAGVMSAH